MFDLNCFQATWRATTASWTTCRVLRCQSAQFPDHRESLVEKDPQDHRENRDPQADQASQDKMDRMGNQEKEASLTKQ